MPFFVVLLLVIGGQFYAIRGFIKYLMLFVLNAGDVPPFLFLTGNPYHTSYMELCISVLMLIGAFAFSTKVLAFDKPRLRLYLFWSMMAGITFQYLWLISAKMVNGVFPFLEESANMVDIGDSVARDIVIGNMAGIRTIVLLIPSVIVFLVLMWLGKQYVPYHDDTMEYLKTWKIRTPRLNVFFEVQEETILPDVILGPNIKTKELVKQKGKDRPLNNVIIGPIGSGKTSALLLPLINQDLHHMSRFINQFPNLFQREDFRTEDVEGQYLNGITIIEPSNDLCQKAFQLVKAHNIPEESVFYIDPTNPNTKGINPLKGPVEKVAESFVMVVEGIGESQEFFFQQSQRTHLKSYIYLLKLHDPDSEPTFDDLIDMYANAQLVHNMHMKLKEQIPANVNDIEERDERNHWKIVKNIDEWFDNSLGVVEERRGPATVQMRVQEGPFAGQFQYYDKKEEHVVGLRNILDDISANKLIRRVLFGHSDFDMDAHLACGGVLLCNTAKGELSELSNVLGKFVLLSVQNAVFRRKPNDAPYHSLIVDEFPDYIYEPFKEFPAQSRKYKVIVTIVAQTVAQLSMKYSDDFLQTLLATCRHKFVYGDIAQKDAELFSTTFGEVERYEESESDQEVSSMLTGATRRSGYSYSKKKDVIMTAQDLIFQPKFVCACKLVLDNEPVPVQQIQANFVPKAEFSKAVIEVEEVNGDIWLEERERFIQAFRLSQEEDLQINEEDTIAEEIQHDIRLDQRTLNKLHYEENYIEEGIDGMPRQIGTLSDVNKRAVLQEPSDSTVESVAAESFSYESLIDDEMHGSAEKVELLSAKETLADSMETVSASKVQPPLDKKSYLSGSDSIQNGASPKNPSKEALSVYESMALQASQNINVEKSDSMDDVFGEEWNGDIDNMFGKVEIDPFANNSKSERVYSDGNPPLLNELQEAVNKVE